MKTNLQPRYFQLELTQSLSVIAVILCFGFDFQTAGYFFVSYAVYLEIRIIYFFGGKFSDAEEKSSNTICETCISGHPIGNGKYRCNHRFETDKLLPLAHCSQYIQK